MASGRQKTEPVAQRPLPGITPAEARRGPGRPREIPEECEKKFTLQLPKDVHKALKIKSAELEVPMTTMILDAIRKVYDI